jgi:hypothetical protein
MAMASSKPGRALLRRELERLIFVSTALRRFTQDSPILPDVWFEYGEKPNERIDLLLTLNQKPPREPAELYVVLDETLDDDDAELAYNQSTVAARLTFEQLVRVVLPLSVWREEAGDICEGWLKIPTESDRERAETASALSRFEAGYTEPPGPQKPLAPRTLPNVLWAIRIIGTIELARQGRLAELEADGEPEQEGEARKERELETPLSEAKARLLVDTVAELIDPEAGKEGLVFSVSRNRRASVTVFRSVPTVKGDAARALFPVDFRSLRWAVIDSGIDASHPAFRMRSVAAAGNGRRRQPVAPQFWAEPFERDGQPFNNTRVVDTYDFTAVRELLNVRRLERGTIQDEPLRQRLAANPVLRDELIETLKHHRPMRWTRFAPLLRVPHVRGQYQPPTHEHGTHVAGILAGDWRQSDVKLNGWEPPDHDLVGVCPELSLYDLRVLGPKGSGDEWAVIAAVQFLFGLTTERDFMTVHGANVSLAIKHDVANYACGRTPVCDETTRLVNAGMVVVTAAGNEGFQRSPSQADIAEGYRTVSITDPGNSEAVITVGATHGYRPYNYGVSYFSSRGPTGDGRAKPDLVAPGEKIWSAIPDGRVRTLDGTSMATPHVSGCAALLMARYRELVGDPARVKHVLCSTASDLGRDRYFQGHGLVDVLRAMQSL